MNKNIFKKLSLLFFTLLAAAVNTSFLQCMERDNNDFSEDGQHQETRETVGQEEQNSSYTRMSTQLYDNAVSNMMARLFGDHSAATRSRSNIAGAPIIYVRSGILLEEGYAPVRDQLGSDITRRFGEEFSINPSRFRAFHEMTQAYPPVSSSGFPAQQPTRLSPRKTLRNEIHGQDLCFLCSRGVHSRDNVESLTPRTCHMACLVAFLRELDLEINPNEVIRILKLLHNLETEYEICREQRQTSRLLHRLDRERLQEFAQNALQPTDGNVTEQQEESEISRNCLRPTLRSLIEQIKDIEQSTPRDRQAAQRGVARSLARNFVRPEETTIRTRNSRRHMQAQIEGILPIRLNRSVSWQTPSEEPETSVITSVILYSLSSRSTDILSFIDDQDSQEFLPF